MLVIGRVVILVPFINYSIIINSVQGVAIVIVQLHLFAMNWVPPKHAGIFVHMVAPTTCGVL